MFFRLGRFLAVAAIGAVVCRADDLDDLDNEDNHMAEEDNEDVGGDAEEMLMQQAGQDFEAMDLDKDGKLSTKDLEEYLNDPSMADEVKDFIEKADTDKDGSVSLEEYTAFVKSVIADYQANGGDHDEGYDDEDNDGEIADLDDEEL